MQDIFLSRIWVNDHERASTDLTRRVDRLNRSFLASWSIRKRIAALAVSIVLSATSISIAAQSVDFRADTAGAGNTEYRTPVAI